ncbi:hypothetical protein DSL92_07880 [Billgrantia gudaonensis]|uniref:Uncharacterized protein n=1 Tax=Billgrantia gudaonensis TaxID=376427 RepID=A0A3S0QRD4_9GAMM|nr:hypothetical protein DSL92_07880 [Halomonas gudaonensis]
MASRSAWRFPVGANTVNDDQHQSEAPWCRIEGGQAAQDQGMHRSILPANGVSRQNVIQRLLPKCSRWAQRARCRSSPVASHRHWRLCLHYWHPATSFNA